MVLRWLGSLRYIFVLKVRIQMTGKLKVGLYCFHEFRDDTFTYKVWPHAHRLISVYNNVCLMCINSNLL